MAAHFALTRNSLIAAAFAGALAVAMPPVSAGDAARGSSSNPQTETDQSQSALALSRDDVVKLQEGLAKLGYDIGPADGVVGPRTRAAIRHFETDHQYSERQGAGEADRVLNVLVQLTLERKLEAEPPRGALAFGELVKQGVIKLPRDLNEKAAEGDLNSQYELAQFYLILAVNKENELPSGVKMFPIETNGME